MSMLNELIAAGKRHRVALTSKKGKPLFELSLLWAVIIGVAAPQALLLTFVLVLLEVIHVEFDGQRLGLT